MGSSLGNQRNIVLLRGHNKMSKMGLISQLYKRFTVTTAGSGAQVTLVSISVPAGTYKVELEGFFPWDGSTGLPSEQLNFQPNGNILWSPFVDNGGGGQDSNYFETKDTHGDTQPGGSTWTAVFCKMPVAIMEFTSDDTISIVFTDYIYGGPVNIDGILMVTSIGEAS
jgi:hypothetical protein